jgi:hypothetical protein
VYIGRTENRWHEDLALPTADLPHLIIAYKKAVEPLTTHSLAGSGVQPVILTVQPHPPVHQCRTPRRDAATAVRGRRRRQVLRADAGRAIAMLMTTETLRHNTYNVSNGRPFTNRQLADALLAITPGLRLDLLPGRQTGPGDNPYLDITRLTDDTGFAPTFDTATAVADYVAWRAENPR